MGLEDGVGLGGSEWVEKQNDEEFCGIVDSAC